MTRQVKVGNVFIGGGAPVSIQSMTNTDTRDVFTTLKQIDALQEAGCQIVRLAIPDKEAARAFGEIKKSCMLPMVADIHFSSDLALMVMDGGADKVRINPGNIGSPDRVEAVLSKAKACGIPIRIGVNSGSVEDRLIENYGGVTSDALVESALDAIKYAESFGFEDLVVSIKSSDIKMNYDAYTKISKLTDVPLHVGLTEAGIGEDARRKSALGIGSLLLAGIGDTIRVSLTGDPVQEVILAKKILSDIGIRRSGINFVSCPTCGRTQVDLPSIAAEVKSNLEPFSERLERAGKSMTVAVMGCPVNGPGEAKNADLGVACGKGVGLIIKRGEIVCKVDEADICKTLIHELNSMI